MAELIELFISELPERIAAIKDALSENDLAMLERLAHQLKGAAGSYGFPTITAAAMAMETSTKAHDDLDQVRRRCQELAELCGHAGIEPKTV